MTISQQDLEKIARLAYLDTNFSDSSDSPDSSDSSKLTQEISSIMDFVDQLRSVDTSNVEPLCHPFALHQRLRADAVTEADCIAELEAMAPMFEDNLYLVPKVMESGK